MIDKLLELLPIVSCQEATRLASLAMDRKLTFKEWVDLKLHLMVCSLCVQFSKQIHELRKILASYSPQDEKHLSPEAKIQMKRALNK